MASDVTAPSGYTLRDAVRADSKGMATVYDGAYPDDSGYPLQTTDAVEHKVFDDDQIRSFVIEADDGDIAATASIKYDSVYSGNAEICRLAVSPDHQGHGLARTLLEHRLAVLEDDPAVDVVFSAAVTSHPYSQHNLAERGFVPAAFLKRIQSGYFSEYRESQAIVVHPDWTADADRTVYVPERFRPAIETILDTLFDDRFGRDIDGFDIDVERVDDPAVARSTEASKMGQWVDTVDDLAAAVDHPGPELLAAVDANTLDSRAFYERIFEYGLTPAGFVPDWLATNGESRDAFIFQYRTEDERVPVEAIDELVTLLDALDITYQVTGGDEYTELEL